MATIFIAHAPSNQEAARALTTILEGYGHTAWSLDKLAPGAVFPEAIETALHQADCVVVLWSEAALATPWVRSAALHGHKTSRLVPVRLEEGLNLPITFAEMNVPTLATTPTSLTPNSLRQVVGWVMNVLETSVPAHGGAAPRTSSARILPMRSATQKASYKLPRWHKIANLS